MTEIINRLAYKGELPKTIANDLKKREIPIPCIRVGNRHTLKYEIGDKDWTANMVRRIAKDRAYQGWVIQGKTRKVSYKSKQVVSVPEEEWDIVKEKIEPLTTAEAQELAIKNINNRTHTKTRTYDWLLKGFLVCKECGKKLSVIPSTNEAQRAKKMGIVAPVKKGRGRPRKAEKTTLYTRCNTYASSPTSRRCTIHSNNLDTLTEVIIMQIKERCKEFINTRELRELAYSQQDKLDTWENSRQEDLTQIQKQIELLNNKIVKIYDDMSEELLTRNDYQRLYKMYNEQRITLENRKKEIEGQEVEENKLIDIEKIVNDFASSKKIDRAMLCNLVDRIEISQDKEIFIYYRFSILNKEKQLEVAS